MVVNGPVCALGFGAIGQFAQVPGEKVVIHFREGHGIKPGDTLRYRGIDLGAVESVHLSDDMQGVDVHISVNARTSPDRR